jgi:nucleoside-triphosphatase THEP1
VALLITGPPGVGKTTAIRAVASVLAGARLGGFFTQEMRSRACGGGSS